MSDPAAVVFDLDDTLYRERRFLLSGLVEVARAMEASYGVQADRAFRCMQAHLRREGRDVLLQTCARTMGLPVRDVPGWVAVIRAHRPRLRLPRSTTATLGALRRKGYRLGILTNGFVETQSAKIDALGLASLVDVVVYANCHAPGGKPHRSCFEAVRTALDVPATRCTFVGDNPVNDIEGARAAGMQTIWLTRAGVPHPMADVIVPTLADVPTVLPLLEERHARASGGDHCRPLDCRRRPDVCHR